MAYTETTTTTYGQRVKKSFGGIGSGILLFIVGTILLWWNEGRAVKTTKMLNEAAGVTVEMTTSAPSTLSSTASLSMRQE